MLKKTIFPFFLCTESQACLSKSPDIFLLLLFGRTYFHFHFRQGGDGFVSPSMQTRDGMNESRLQIKKIPLPSLPFPTHFFPRPIRWTNLSGSSEEEFALHCTKWEKGGGGGGKRARLDMQEEEGLMERNSPKIKKSLFLPSSTTIFTPPALLQLCGGSQRGKKTFLLLLLLPSLPFSCLFF